MTETKADTGGKRPLSLKLLIRTWKNRGGPRAIEITRSKSGMCDRHHCDAFATPSTPCAMVRRRKSESPPNSGGKAMAKDNGLRDAAMRAGLQLAGPMPKLTKQSKRHT